jgi:hypothetical protein
MGRGQTRRVPHTAGRAAARSAGPHTPSPRASAGDQAAHALQVGAHSADRYPEGNRPILRRKRNSQWRAAMGAHDEVQTRSVPEHTPAPARDEQTWRAPSRRSRKGRAPQPIAAVLNGRCGSTCAVQHRSLPQGATQHAAACEGSPTLSSPHLRRLLPSAAVLVRRRSCARRPRRSSVCLCSAHEPESRHEA